MNSDPFQPADSKEQSVWQALEDMRQPDPSDTLRRTFYAKMRRREQRLSWLQPRAWAPALATLILGLWIGNSFLAPATSVDGMAQRNELDMLNARVSSLNQAVAVALLANDSASERLRGIRVAASMDRQPEDITRVLLATAHTDPVSSVRSAALEALGPRIADDDIGTEIFRLLLDTDQPLVQLTLADLIMRWGSDEQLMTLIEAARNQSLTVEVAQFVLDRIREPAGENQA